MSEQGQPEFGDDIRRSIGIRISVLSRQMRNSFDRRVADLGVTRSQWQMIAVVSRRPGATQRVIADAMEMSEASAGRLIDRLCADGLLERRERHDDRRARAVYLTRQAEPLLEQLSEIGRHNEERLFRGLSDDELASLDSCLAKIAKNLG